MKNYIFTFLCLFSISSFINSSDYSQVPSTVDPKAMIENDFIKLDCLIEVTRTNLDTQQKLRHLIKEYQALQKNYLVNGQKSELLLPMVRLAYKINTLIEKNHLAHLFEAEFLNEITIFAKMAVKKSIPQP